MAGQMACHYQIDFDPDFDPGSGFGYGYDYFAVPSDRRAGCHCADYHYAGCHYAGHQSGDLLATG